mgnify:CR=1 FL=1
MVAYELRNFQTPAASALQAAATIVDGERQKPTYPTQGFAVDTEAYLYNVGADTFFCAGNSWGTQASVGESGLLVKFADNGVK